jgi:putative ABC transport system permease protein
MKIRLGIAVEERLIINPIISYPEAVAFKNKYGYPFTQTSLSFTATSAAEIKYEATKTDPEMPLWV